MSFVSLNNCKKNGNCEILEKKGLQNIKQLTVVVCKKVNWFITTVPAVVRDNLDNIICHHDGCIFCGHCDLQLYLTVTCNTLAHFDCFHGLKLKNIYYCKQKQRYIKYKQTLLT